MNIENEDKGNKKTKKRFIKFLPSLITSLRILFIPLFLYVFFLNLNTISFLLFLSLSLTDVLDGYIARKMDTTSSIGAYFDTITDFILLFTAFSAFVIKGIYPYWILILIMFMFLQFILTSNIKMPVYDPVGKYFGAVLFGGALITLLFENTFLYDIITIFILIFAIISLLSRYISLFIKWRKLKKSK
ncbi:MAG: CDP-alcohol phosphatidyltransferase family protein [Methanobacterium sp.]